MISLRVTCDECGAPAVIIDGDAFLCERCDVEINGAVENSITSATTDVKAPAAPDAPNPLAVGAPLSELAGAPSAVATGSLGTPGKKDQAFDFFEIDPTKLKPFKAIDSRANSNPAPTLPFPPRASVNFDEASASSLFLSPTLIARLI